MGVHGARPEMSPSCRPVEEDHPMRRLTVLISLLLAGCAGDWVWVHDTADQARYLADIKWCEGAGELAVAYLDNLEYAMFRDSYYLEAFQDCMDARGYERMTAAEAPSGKSFRGGFGMPVY